MDARIHRGVFSGLQRQARFFRLLAMALGIAVIAQSAAILSLGNVSQRVVIVPPEVNAEFWIEDKQVSKRYFLEWGHYLSSLLLNVTPESVTYQGEILLRHVAQPSKDVFERRLKVAAEHLRKEKLSTFFSVSDVMVDHESAKVAFTGTLSSYVAGRRVGERQAAYMAVFVVRRGRLHLVEFVETHPSDPFTPPQT